MPLIPLLLAAALAAPPAAPPARAAEPAPAVEGWLSASGEENSAEPKNPDAAVACAERLRREGSHAAASRALEAMVRRWPGAPQAEPAMLGAAREALAAGDFDRALKLIAELRSRWPASRGSMERDLLEVRVGEERLIAARAPGVSSSAAGKHAAAAQKIFAAVTRRERAGPVAERAKLGSARALHALGRERRAIAVLEAFLRDFPRSELAAEASRELAAIRSARFRGRSPERQVLAEASTQADYARQYLEVQGSESTARQALDETYMAIASRQAELKIEEAKLYIRLKRPGAAEWVLRSVLRHYGDTPSAARAAELLEELSVE